MSDYDDAYSDMEEQMDFSDSEKDSFFVQSVE